MAYWITVLPQKRKLQAEHGDTLLSVLRGAGVVLDAPCGGEGRCGKCRVMVDGTEILACRTAVDRDMTVTLPERGGRKILADSIPSAARGNREKGCFLAFDIGTTTVVGSLLEAGTGKTIAVSGVPNPQAAYGADVITRIRHGVQGQMAALTAAIRECLNDLTEELCRKAGVAAETIRFISVVGNPAMQQFLLDISVENLAKVPFATALTELTTIPAGNILPLWRSAELLVVPDIAGFVGADTVACVLALEQDRREEITLLVDIGTNGEMVLGNRNSLVACSAAAGPALEGAGIRLGMGGQNGAVDHVWAEDGKLQCSVIGGGEARGICGSGLIDAVAAALDQKQINERGKILTEDGLIHLTQRVYLTQEDIRQVQLAKGAIAAGIRLMAKQMGIALSDIRQVFLAGAFGTYMNPRSACRIGLLPKELESKITAVGNAAGRGAGMLACSQEAQQRAQSIAGGTRALELGALPEFPRYFAKNMRF